MNGWQWRHLDCVLAFTQALTDADLCLKTLAGFHVEDSDGNDVSDEHCLKLLKNYYGSFDAVENWSQVLSSSLEERGFKKSDIDPCLFALNDCISVYYVDDCLVFYKKK